MNQIEFVEKNSFAALDVTELKSRLATAVTVTARGLFETALIFEELRQRGEPVDDLRLSLAPYLPRIARGELAAEVVIGLAGFKTALDRVALLSPENQRVAIDRQYPVVVALDGDTPTVAMRRIADLSAREVRALISEDGRILEPAVQAENLRGEAKKRPARTGVLPRGRQPTVSAAGDYITIGRQAVKRAYLLESLRALGVIS
jgi:hypothetical protein